MLLGFGSVTIALAFWLSIGASLLCVVYGLMNWNNSGGACKGPDCRDEGSE